MNARGDIIIDAQQFPAEFQGKYFDLNSHQEIDGALCILHYRDAAKDAAKCAAAVERKKQAADPNFRGVLLRCDVQFQGQIENADFTGAEFSGLATCHLQQSL